MSWLDELADFAFHQMPEHGREELLSRGVSDEQAEIYQIGYLDKELIPNVPEDFSEWSKQGLKLDQVFVFPLTTAMGEIRGFQFRHVDRKKSGYMDYFLDRREACLFGLKQAVEPIWTSRSVYLVEGVFDLFPIQRATPNVIATLTAYANKSTVRLLKRISRKVWLGYDMDKPGLEGRNQFYRNYNSFFQVYTVEYPKVNGTFIKDPGELWEVWGDSQLVPFIRSAIAENTSVSHML